MAIEVREPRTGMPVNDPSWAAWRARWDRRPLSLRARVKLCAWCWGYGALETTHLGAIGVPCLSCGRVGVTT
ncbi:MAG: hypothetical protein AB7O78_01570 [Thermoleophilia bacterium]